MDEMDDALEVEAETENYVVYRTEEGDEITFHVELGTVTLHLLEDEWKELVELIRAVDSE